MQTKQTWGFDIFNNHSGIKYHYFKSFKVYWAYREYLSEKEKSKSKLIEVYNIIEKEN